MANFFAKVIVVLFAGGHFASSVDDVQDILTAMDEKLVGVTKRLEKCEENTKEIDSMKQMISILTRENNRLMANELTLEERVQHLEELSKIKTLRTCHELAQHGVTTSGWYYLDPDGDLIGKPPIEVFCDFETGETLIHHDSEETIVADHCLTTGCFQHKIQYSAPMEQIVALSQISGLCRQAINFGCYSAQLSNNLNVNLGWWTDRNDDRQYFFTGDHVGEHICTCGLDNSCNSPDGTDRKCNCDAKSPEWFNDAGIITATDVLPISSVVYGPLFFSAERANFTVGPLKCSGQKQEDSSSITCNTLKRSGIFQSSGQILKTGDYPRLSYCDMASSDGYDGEMETMLTYTDVTSLPGGVYFAGIQNSGEVIAGNDITFSKTLINIGNGFDATMGHFVAPVAGNYEFSISGRAYQKASIQVRLNGQVAQYFYQENGPDANEQSDDESHIFNLMLEKDDDIHLFLDSGTLQTPNNYVTITFIGKLISEIS